MGVDIQKPKKKAKKADFPVETVVEADHKSASHQVTVPGANGIVDEIKTAIAHTLVKHPDGAEKSTSEQVAVAVVKGPMANVGVKMGRKINTGNYSSSTIEVSFHAPCEMSEDDINSTYDFAVQWVDGKMSELLTKYEG